uniref:Uncharacterized protein n=1 Tax=Apteryx owenii TaxID=8824 RepID=A0A8B9QN52_APTOW
MAFPRDLYDDVYYSPRGFGDLLYGFGGLRGNQDLHRLGSPYSCYQDLYRLGSPYSCYQDLYRFGSPYGYRSFGNLYGNRGQSGYGDYYGYGDLQSYGYSFPFSSRFGNRYSYGNFYPY